MDELDDRILALLRTNARMTAKDIARQVSLTGPAVGERIRRMEREGVIEGYTVRVARKKSAATIDALISVSVTPGQQESFLSLAQNSPAVLQCFHVTGSHSFLVKVNCEGIAALEKLITTFQQLGHTSSQIILSTPVDRHTPLEYEEELP